VVARDDPEAAELMVVPSRPENIGSSFCLASAV